MRTFRKSCRPFSFLVVLPDYFLNALNALFHVFHELRKLKLSIRYTMKCDADIADELVHGMSGKLMKLVKRRIKEDPMA